MSVGITFGSIGDLIAVGQVAWSLAQALSSTRGSAKEFQDLARELQNFNNVLLQVIALWQNYESSAELDELGRITNEAMKEWQDSLCEFRMKFEKRYRASLQPGGSGNWLKDTSKKFLWLKEKEDITEMRQKISGANSTITLLVLAAMGKSNKLDEITQKLRIEGVHIKLQESSKLAEVQNAHLERMHKQLVVQSNKSNLIVAKVTSSISTLMQVKSIIIDIRMILESFRAQMFIPEPRGLDAHWKQAPVTLEDALGHLIPIPLELIDSWDMFEIVLLKRFEKMKGHQKVIRKEYAIEDGRSGQEISVKDEWSMCFRPGQKINMAIVFKQNQATTACPGCGTEADSGGESITQCKKCDMWFQQLEEISIAPQQNDSFETMVPTLQAMQPQPEAKISEVIEDTPGDFKRVRLLYQGIKQDQELKKLESIRFMDVRGRKFLFPFHLCHSWPGMEQLIFESFRYDENLGTRVSNGHYDIVDATGNKISSRDWESSIVPGLSVTMRLRPIVEDVSLDIIRNDEPMLSQEAEQLSQDIEPRATRPVSRQIYSDALYGQLGFSQVPRFSPKNETDPLLSPDIVNKQKSPVPASKSILRRPREQFTEDKWPIREGIEGQADRHGVPPNARWTKISRRLVNPTALGLGKERYEAHNDFVIVFRVLTKEEIYEYANTTAGIRKERRNNRRTA